MLILFYQIHYLIFLSINFILLYLFQIFDYFKRKFKFIIDYVSYLKYKIHDI